MVTFKFENNDCVPLRQELKYILIRILVISVTWISSILYGLYLELETNPLLGTQFSGKASFYASKFHGKITANGEKMDKEKLTCAHKTLPFNTMLEVTNPDNGKKIVVRVNDRGPFSGSRVLDLSAAAADSLEMREQGVIQIQAMVVGTEGEVYVSSAAPIIYYLRSKEQKEQLAEVNE